MAESRVGILTGYLTGATLGWEWVHLGVVGPLLLIVITAIVAARERFHRWLLMALVAGIVINIVVVKAQAYRVSFMYVLVAFAAFCILGALKQARWLRVGWACLFLAVVLALGAPDLYGRYRTLPTNADEVGHAIAKVHYSAIYFDDYAAWYVFGWLLPEKAQSLQNSKKYSPLPPRAGEIYIVQESDYRRPHPRIFGREFASVNLNNKRWDVVDFRGVSLLSGSNVGLHLSDF